MPATIITHAYGVIESIALLIFCAGSKRLATPQASFLLHPVATHFSKNTEFEASDLQTRLASLANDATTISNIIAETMQTSADNTLALMNAATRLTANDALAGGMIHEIRRDLYSEGEIVIID